MPLHPDFHIDIRLVIIIVVGVIGATFVLLASNQIDEEYESIDQFLTARTTI